MSCLYPQGNKPFSAIQCQKFCMWLLLQAEMAWLPEWDGDLPRCQCRRIPHAPSLWCWQVVLAKPSLHPELIQPGPQLPRGAKVLKTHMDLVRYYGWSKSCSPLLAHGANPTSSRALSVLARQVICLMGQRQGSLMRTFSSVYIW